MAYPKACPECGSTDRKRESGEFALIQLTQGRLQLHVDAAKTIGEVVRVVVCRGCGYVALFEVA